LTPRNGKLKPADVNFRQTLEAELGRRRAANARYSLRAFARYLGTDHATLSQILRGRRNLSPKMVRRLGARLGLGRSAITDACVRQEAAAILRLAHLKTFRPNSRWIATRTGIPLDGVNAALHRLIHDGALVMQAADRWVPTRSTYA
jgi:transcriptional regulator with XRE-family HTH domain